jgi:hypothetical protein
MNKNYKVYERQTITDLQKTCTNVMVMDKSTGELFMHIGTAKVNPRYDEYNRAYGERLSFTRGYIGALKKARASMLPEYERIEREYQKLRKQLIELDMKIIDSKEYLDDLLGNYQDDDEYESDDDDDDE